MKSKLPVHKSDNLYDFLNNLFFKSGELCNFIYIALQTEENTF